VKEATLSHVDTPTTPTATTTHIDIPGDVLITDAEFCREVLDDATRRTSRRYDREGLPYVMIRGRKFRPLNAGRAWIAGRIKAHVAYRPTRSRRASRPKATTAERAEVTA
jgi:hypothetical protein